MVRGMEELTYKINKKPLPANRVFNLTVNILLIFIVVIVVYPLYFVLIASVSDPAATNTGRVIFLPVKIGFEAYKRIFSDKDIWTGYYNTILYTLGGTVFGLFSTITAGYSLSRKDLPGRGLIAGLMVFTMYFSGGLIPTYMVIKAIGLVNTRTVLMIYGCFSVYNLIICKTYFEQNIPDELFEAASIDGCGNGLFFLRIVIPVSKAIVSVMVLYYAVAQWNGFFRALIYVKDQALYPLQLILRDILIGSQLVIAEGTDLESVIEIQRMAETIKYGVIVVSSLPMMVIYLLLQRFIEKGIMLGAVKG